MPFGGRRFFGVPILRRSQTNVQAVYPVSPDGGVIGNASDAGTNGFELGASGADFLADAGTASVVIAGSRSAEFIADVGTGTVSVAGSKSFEAITDHGTASFEFSGSEFGEFESDTGTASFEISASGVGGIPVPAPVSTGDGGYVPPRQPRFIPPMRRPRYVEIPPIIRDSGTANFAFGATGSGAISEEGTFRFDLGEWGWDQMVVIDDEELMMVLMECVP